MSECSSLPYVRGDVADAQVPTTADVRPGAWIGPMGPGDGDAVAACFAGLSPAALHRRFHSPVHHVSDAFLADLARRAADGLVLLARSGDRVVGVAELAGTSAEPGTYEAAVVIADDWRRRGVAATLLREVGRRVPGSRVRARIQHDNTSAIGLARTLVPAADRHVDDGLVVELTLPGQARSSTSSYPARRHAM